MKTTSQVPLSEIMAERSGSVDPASYPDELFDLYSIPAFDKGMPDTVRGSEIGSTKQVVQPGDVLLSKIVPHIRRAWVVGPKNGNRIIASGEWIVFRSERVVPEYLRHVLMGDPFHAQFMKTVSGVGGSLLRARPAHVAAIKIPLPHPTEQRRIADILDEADALRRKRAEAIRLANDLVPSVFYQMFGENLADPRQQTPLEEVAEIGSGVMKGRTFNGQATVELPYLRVANVQAGYLDLSEMKTITVPVSEVNKYRLQHHDIVLTEGGDFDKLGRGALWESQVDDCVHQNHIFRVRCNQKRLIPLYFATYLQSHSAVAYFLRCAKKTTNLATINMTQLRQLPVHLPSPPQQKEFADRLVELREISDTQSRSKVEFDNLFHSLLQRAFRGEL